MQANLLQHSIICNAKRYKYGTGKREKDGKYLCILNIKNI
ncbi:hypothetical protein CLOAM1532 [Candidatus Cloacimonas acidaminovorans str. Evry]|uniref:Uncharacterized protein n=1 Tax=Cloacimonas acidaminovorans (strain Evry) TaxID=459349 RepID=B0VFV0_CLOAI|nr:hypothetical protein CLOAM1532 [Candidatus Cloacimonas acidaminovorans str. Evry]